MNDYYVYIYYRLDTNEPFYVGMGHNNRWRDLKPSQRNKYFTNIINKYSIACEIIKNNLTREQALGIECWLIHELVFEYGYSIDIQNNRSKEKGCHLVNATWGGEGASGCKHTEEWKEQHSKDMKGENNPMYGVRMCGENNHMYGKHLSEETKEKISKANKGRNPLANKTEEEMEIIREKKSINLSGKNNPMYGKYGKDHPSSKSVICLTTKRIFFTAKEGGIYYNIKSTSSVGQCCNKKLKSAGKLENGTRLVWCWLIWNHNKKYRIKKIKER